MKKYHFLSWKKVLVSCVTSAFFVVISGKLPVGLARADEKSNLLLSTYTTYFSKAENARSHNIFLAAKKLRRVVIPPNGKFSFNRAVGARSEENGFLPAPVIVEGAYLQGVGGGVCQVSTTLYNAVLLAGLKVDYVGAHSLQVGYVPPSCDAMVSEYNDLLLTNPFSTPVAIMARVSAGEITFSVYGRGDGFDYAVESVLVQSVPPDPPLEVESKEECKKEKWGVVSESYLVKSRWGKVVRKTRLRRDKYSPVRGAVLKESETKGEESTFFG